MHLPGAHLLKSCTRRQKCVHRVQDAPLILNTVMQCITYPVTVVVHSIREQTAQGQTKFLITFKGKNREFLFKKTAQLPMFKVSLLILTEKSLWPNFPNFVLRNCVWNSTVIIKPTKMEEKIIISTGNIYPL